MQVVKKITVDLCNPYPMPIIKAKQCDTGRGIIVTLADNGVIRQLSHEQIRIYAKKPDNTIVYNNCAIRDGAAAVMLTNQMLAVEGEIQVEIEVADGDDIITTPIFKLQVLPTNISDMVIESTNEFGALREALSVVEDISDLRGEVDTKLAQQDGDISSLRTAVSNHLTAQDETLQGIADSIPVAMTQEAATAGIETTAKTISAKVLHDTIEGHTVATQSDKGWMSAADKTELDRLSDLTGTATLQTTAQTLTGAVNELNSEIAMGALDWWGLVETEVRESSTKDVDLASGRNLSDFNWLVFAYQRGNYFRATQILPRSLFEQGTGRAVELTYTDSLNDQRWVDVIYKSDTQITVSTGTKSTGTLMIYGIGGLGVY